MTLGDRHKSGINYNPLTENTKAPHQTYIKHEKKATHQEQDMVTFVQNDCPI